MKRRYTEKLPHEVFELIENTPKASDRVNILKENESYAIKTILKGAFDPLIVFDLPPGAPEYKPDVGPAGLQPAPLKRQIDILAKCLKNSPLNGAPYPNLNKERLFIKLLETAHAKDALIIIAMKDKKLSKLYPSVTAALTRKAFPNLL